MSAGEIVPGPAGSRDRFVAVDWGSTRLRLRLLAPSAVLAEVSSPLGIGSVAPGDHQRVFLDELEKLLGLPGLRDEWRTRGGEVYFAGMVTSTLGWFPTPYVEVPAGADRKSVVIN